MTSDSLGLNFDIWIEVYHLLDRHGISSLMRTCRSLYGVGISDLLSSVDLSTAKRRAILSFCDLMLAKSFNLDRFYFLRTLIFSGKFHDYANHRVANTLASVLKQASHVERLTVWHAAHFFGVSSETRTALSSLPRLTLLELDDTTNETLEAVLLIQSPIHSLYITHSPFHDDDPHPLPSLPNISSTLSNLSLEGLSFDSTQVVYPQMRSFSIDGCSNPDIANLMGAFPKLSNLSVPLDDLFSAGHLEESRLHNRQEINAFGDPWTSLESLDGDVNTIYSLGLMPCQVTHLTLGLVNMAKLPYLLQLLDDFDPQDLEIYLSCEGHGIASLKYTMLRPIFRKISSRCCSLSLKLLADQPLVNIADLLVSSQHLLQVSSLKDSPDELSVFLNRLSLDTLRLHVFHGSFRITPADGIEEYVEAVDFEAFASNSFKNIPTLRCLVICVGETFVAGSAYKFWRVPQEVGSGDINPRIPLKSIQISEWSTAMDSPIPTI